MSIDARPDGDEQSPDESRAATDDGPASRDAGAGAGAEAADGRNGVAVHFADGSVAHYAFVVRERGADWLYAERLVGDGDGLDDEEAESINADAVHRVRSEAVHRFEDGVVHHASGLLVEPEALLSECGLDR